MPSKLIIRWRERKLLSIMSPEPVGTAFRIHRRAGGGYEFTMKTYPKPVYDESGLGSGIGSGQEIKAVFAPDQAVEVAIAIMEEIGTIDQDRYAAAMMAIEAQYGAGRQHVELATEHADRMGFDLELRD